MSLNSQVLLAPRTRWTSAAVLFAFAACVAGADLASKEWAVATLASPAHPLFVSAARPQPAAALLAERGIGAAEAKRLHDNRVLVRLQRATLKAESVVTQGQIGRLELVASASTGFPPPRGLRLRPRDLGRPLGEVLAEAWRVEPAGIGAVLAEHTWQVSDTPAELSATIPAGEALAVVERRIEVLPNWYHLLYAENPGAAFSFLQSAPPLVRHLLFTVLAALASLGLSYWLWRGQLGSALSAWSLAAILGGAIGNLVDRVRYQVVVDFLYMFITLDGKTHGWPVYNIADIGITCGVILIAAESLLRRQPVISAADPPAPTPSAT